MTAEHWRITHRVFSRTPSRGDGQVDSHGTEDEFDGLLERAIAAPAKMEAPSTAASSTTSVAGHRRSSPPTAAAAAAAAAAARVVVLGPPRSGKRTQATQIGKILGVEVRHRRDARGRQDGRAAALRSRRRR